MQKSLHIDPNKCTGCLQCEMACSWENHRSFTIAKSRIKVFSFHEAARFVPYTCTQCDEAWCMMACPTEAIKLDPVTGAKIVLDPTCVGCKVCTIACPLRHHQLRGLQRQGAEVRPLRRCARLRQGLPHGCHHLRGCRLDGT